LRSSAVGIVVYGMGRRGTSAVTGLFASCGCYIGRDEDLLAPNKANPSGYQENVRVVEQTSKSSELSRHSWFARSRTHGSKCCSRSGIR